MLPRLIQSVRSDTTTLLLIGAVLIGSMIGMASEQAGEQLGSLVDRTVLLLLLLLALEIPLHRVRLQQSDAKVLIAAWVTNFLVIPPLGMAIASLFLRGDSLLATGVFIYFLAPCTDWFLGFTRLANGNVRLGSILLPLNMATQLALYPVYLTLFTRWNADLDLAFTGDTIIRWFVVPFGAAILIRFVLQLPVFTGIERVRQQRVGSLIPAVIALLVAEIFASNISVISENLSAFARILLAVFCFFVITWYLAEFISFRLQFAHADRVLFAFTTAARNAPLMLGVTIAAIPDQPLLYAAIVIGMLVEFPHLTAIRHLLGRHQETVSESAKPGLVGWRGT